MRQFNHSSRFIEQFSKPGITRVPLIDLCSLFIDGDWIEAKDQSDSGYRLVQTGNVGVCEYLDKKDRSRFVSEETFKRLNCTEIHSGDILFSRLPDPIGRCCIIPKDFPKAITAVDCTITRLKDNCLPEYLMIYTTTTMYSEQIKKCVTGTTRQRISRGNLAKITIPLPDKMKQVEFVNLVHQSDKSKFVGFKSRFIAHFLNASYDKKRLGEVCCVISGKTIDLALENEGGPIAYLKVADLNLAENDRVVTASSRYVSEQTALTSGLVPIGATIFPKNGAAALHNKKRITSIITCVDMNTMAVYSKSDTVKPEYLYAFLESRDLATLALVGAIPQIRAKDVQALMIPVPNVEEQEKYITMMHQADKSKYLN